MKNYWKRCIVGIAIFSVFALVACSNSAKEEQEAPVEETSNVVQDAVPAGLTNESGWICSNCGTENRGYFCSECGVKAPEEYINGNTESDAETDNSADEANN